MRLRPAWFLLAVVSGPSPIRGDEGPRPASVRDFYNVVAPDGADPWVIHHTDGWYYATITTGRDVTLIRSRTISAVGAGERKVIYDPPPGSKNLWAPEIHPLGGRWYVYVAIDDGDNANHRLFVLENSSPDPFAGRFTRKGKIADPSDDRWAIDATVLELRGRPYLIWSGWEGDKDVAQDLYIAPMRDPWTLAGPRVRISRPTLPWERRGGPPWINEGPQTLVRGDRVFLIFSASGSWTDHYCLGLLSSRVDADLLSPSSWVKHPNPVFESANGVFGPGHGSFVKSPDGREDWLLYHAARWGGSGWERLLRAQPFTWNADGTPRFDEPAPPNRPIPLPGGEPPRLRLEAESAELAGSARVAPDPSCSAGGKVKGIDGDGSVSFLVRVGHPGKFVLLVRHANVTPEPGRAGHRLTVNQGVPRTVRYEPNGPVTWSVASATVDLIAGENRLRFARGEGTAEIDCVDLIP